MRRFLILGATLALTLAGATLVAAASPTPSATAHPASTPRPSPATHSTATPSTAPHASAAPVTSFTANVQPLQLTGTATVTETAGGSGTVTLKISGLVANQSWSVDIDGGTAALPNERADIAFKAGSQVTRLGSDTVRIQLTKSEMAAFLKARSSGGVVAMVSDGLRVAAAEFTAG